MSDLIKAIVDGLRESTIMVQEKAKESGEPLIVSTQDGRVIKARWDDVFQCFVEVVEK